MMHSVVTTATGSTDMGVEEPDMVMPSAGQGTAVGLLRWREGSLNNNIYGEIFIYYLM